MMAASPEKTEQQHGEIPPASKGITSAALRWIVAGMLVAGLAFHVAPLFNQGGRLLRQFPSEDGYLMMTIARNVALGRGMSTAEGTIPTNGTQPLTTFFWAGCFAAAGGDRAWGVALVQVLSIVSAVLTTWWIYRLGREVLGEFIYARQTSALAAAAWFLSPRTVAHTMNCLETGFYTLAVLGCAHLYLHWSHDRLARWSIGRCILFGVALGAAFWARNDAVFLIAAICLVHVASGLGRDRQLFLPRVVETFVFGATSVVVATPWLANNYLRFGSLVPISGIAESHSARFASNLYLIPIKLSEYLRLVGGTPNSLEANRIVVAVSALSVLVAIIIAVITVPRATSPARRLYAVVGIYGAFLCTYYGLLFGAPHFVSRYLMPLSPFIFLWTVAVLAHVWQWAERRSLALAALAAGLLALAVGVAEDARVYWQGSSHQHFQVKGWIEKHVPEDAWVGAIQTGTIGFFHERTVNLDGKVNPDALKANLDGKLPEYVIASPIEYLADWVGIADWKERYFRDDFDLIVRDPKANLAVLKRKPGHEAKPK